MPTRKQQKRDRKRRTHAVSRYTPPAVAPRPPREERPAGSAAGRRGARRVVAAGRGRRIRPASWRRALRRAPLFFVGMFAAIHFLPFLHTGVSTTTELIQALFFSLVTIPGTYATDRVAYGAAQKRGTAAPR